MVKSTIMKVLLGEALVFLSLLLRIQSTSDATFEEDFVHSFLIKQDKLAMSERLKAAGEGWLEKTAYKVSYVHLAFVNK